MATKRWFGFRCLHTSRIAGHFAGYAPGAIYRLAGGSCWRQITDRTEPADRNQPEAWIYTDGVGTFLHIDKVLVVEVRACRDSEGPGELPDHSAPPRPLQN